MIVSKRNSCSYPSFLIVVPTLDSFKALPSLLSSLEKQSWPYWRILFVDGASSTEHIEWLSKYCLNEPRCSWIRESPEDAGIFGAMNQGFAAASSEANQSEWLLFWGSDDWAADQFVLESVVNAIRQNESMGVLPDLLICRGQYFDVSTGSQGRSATFHASGFLDAAAYRRSLKFGNTPPHQATLFGPGARRRLSHYEHGFRLSADLDYFLQLSRYSGLHVQCLDLELVHMASGGVSGQQTWRRLQEVRRAYRRAFGWFWWFPFLLRYLRRLASLVALGSS